MTNSVVPAIGGGTGRQSLAANSLLVGDGGGPVKLVAPAAPGDVLRWNGAAWTSEPAPLPRGHLAGLALANNAADANNDIDIAAGAARSDDDAANIVLSSPLTKRLDAAWAPGSGSGGLDSGVKANNTWYHLHAILKPADGTVDVLFSTSATAPALPVGFTRKRRIGAVRTDAAGNLRLFTQLGDRFWFVVAVLDVNATMLTSRTPYSLTVPLGVRGVASILLTATQNAVLALSPAQGDTAPIGGSGICTILPVGAARVGGSVEVPFDQFSQITLRGEGAVGSWIVHTIGWLDRRGRDD